MRVSIVYGSLHMSHYEKYKSSLDWSRHAMNMKSILPSKSCDFDVTMDTDIFILRNLDFAMASWYS